MSSLSHTPDLTAESAQYQRDGFLLVRGLFAATEVSRLNRHFDALHAAGVPGRYEPKRDAADPLERYPRMMHPHRFDDLAKQTLLDPRVLAILRVLLGEEPIAGQSMYYWKPPGGRGQELHQDNFYLQVKPHSCIAAWTALDRCDGENGGLKVVPHTHDYPIQCPEQADLSASFVNHLVRPPAGTAPVQLIMEPGDTLFFNGNVIHGSEPNRSATRFRRAFICHYLPASARQASRFFFPLLDRDGREVAREPVDDGGPCGVEETAPLLAPGTSGRG